jgi:predicted transcriptional regulator
MKNPPHAHLSRREREIMDIVYELGEASVADVLRRMADEPSYNSVRVTLGILAKKGHLKHHSDGRRYIYSPTLPREKASQSAVTNLVKTFFDGSPSRAILRMLDMSSGRLTDEELDEIAEMIEKGKKS